MGVFWKITNTIRGGLRPRKCLLFPDNTHFTVVYVFYITLCVFVINNTQFNNINVQKCDVNKDMVRVRETSVNSVASIIFTLAFSIKANIEVMSNCMTLTNKVFKLC